MRLEVRAICTSVYCPIEFRPIEYPKMPRRWNVLFYGRFRDPSNRRRRSSWPRRRKRRHHSGPPRCPGAGGSLLLPPLGGGRDRRDSDRGTQGTSIARRGRVTRGTVVPDDDAGGRRVMSAAAAAAGRGTLRDRITPFVREKRCRTGRGLL